MKTTTQELIEGNDTIIAFHIGRGGRFNNSGHLYVVGEMNIQELIYLKSDKHWTFAGYEKQNKIKAAIESISPELVNRFEAAVDNCFDEEKIGIILDECSDLDDNFKYTLSDLGEAGLLDYNGNFIISNDGLNSGIGSIDWDGKYDSDYTTYAKDLTEEEIDAIKRSQGFNGLLVSAIQDAELAEDLDEETEE